MCESVCLSKKEREIGLQIIPNCRNKNEVMSFDMSSFFREPSRWPKIACLLGNGKWGERIVILFSSEKKLKSSK